MLVYTSGLALSMFLVYFYSKYQDVFNKALVIRTLKGNRKEIHYDFMKYIPMLPLMLIAGLRYDVGQDYMYTYVPIFQQVLSGNASQAWGDFGFITLNKFRKLQVQVGHLHGRTK